MDVDLELDCRGMLCPLPVIELGRRIGEVPVGGLVAVVATDVAARTDVPAWCRMRGHEYVGEEAAPDGAAGYVVRRLGGRSAPGRQRWRSGASILRRSNGLPMVMVDTTARAS